MIEMDELMSCVKWHCQTFWQSDLKQYHHVIWKTKFFVFVFKGVYSLPFLLHISFCVVVKKSMKINFGIWNEKHKNNPKKTFPENVFVDFHFIFPQCWTHPTQQMRIQTIYTFSKTRTMFSSVLTHTHKMEKCMSGEVKCQTPRHALWIKSTISSNTILSCLSVWKIVEKCVIREIYSLSHHSSSSASFVFWMVLLWLSLSLTRIIPTVFICEEFVQTLQTHSEMKYTHITVDVKHTAQNLVCQINLKKRTNTWWVWQRSSTLVVLCGLKNVVKNINPNSLSTFRPSFMSISLSCVLKSFSSQLFLPSSSFNKTCVNKSSSRTGDGMDFGMFVLFQTPQVWEGKQQNIPRLEMLLHSWRYSRMLRMRLIVRRVKWNSVWKDQSLVMFKMKWVMFVCWMDWNNLRKTKTCLWWNNSFFKKALKHVCVLFMWWCFVQLHHHFTCVWKTHTMKMKWFSFQTLSKHTSC